MAYDLSLFTKLIGQAGSSAALQAKFPYLCDIRALANALQNSNYGPLDPARNPNGYDRWDMAREIIRWFDEFADYPSGKAPQTISERFQSTGMIWSQGEFWRSGVYKVEQDRGFTITNFLYAPSGQYYQSAATLVVDDPVQTYPWTETATVTHNLLPYGPIDYIVKTGTVSGPGQPKLFISMTSDDLYSFFWENDVLSSTTDTSGNTFSYSGTTPNVLPVAEEKYVGWNARRPGLTVPNNTINDLLDGIDYPSRTNVRDHPSLMFKADIGIRNKTFTLATTGAGTAVEPTFSVIAPHDAYWSSEPVLTDELIPVQYLFDETGAYPLEATDIISGVKRTDQSLYQSAIVAPPIHYPGLVQKSLGNPPIYGEQPIDMVFGVTSNQLYFNSLTSRGSGYLNFKGYPVYQIDVEYAKASAPSTILTTRVYVPLLQMKNFNMYLFDAIVSVNHTGKKVIGDVTFDAGFDVDGIWFEHNFTAVQTTYDSGITYSGGAGYDFTPISVTTTDPGVWGRFTSARIAFGKGLPNLVDEEDLSVPTDTSLQVSVTGVSRMPRPITTILHSDYYTEDDDTTYRHSWFGTDNEYEDTEYWAREVVLTNNKITGFGSYEKESLTTFTPAAPGYPYGTVWVEETLNPNGLQYAYDGGPYGNKGEYDNIPESAFLADIRWNSLDKGVFNVVLTDGKVVGFTTISRIDGDGTYNPGGWGYSANQRRRLTFVRNNAVPLNPDTILPEAYYETNDPATNGVGNEADWTSGDDFFPGFNIPEGAFLFAIAYGNNPESPLVTEATYSHLDGNDADTASQRPLHPGFYPAEITITSERPVLRSTTRSLIDNVRTTGAQRYRFEYKYPPMTQDSAKSLVAAFEKYRGGAKAFQIRLPRVGVKLFQEVAQDASYSSYIAPTTYYPEGDNEIKFNGLPTEQQVVNEGTFFRFVDDNKLYQVVENANSNAYGEAVWRIEPGLKAAKGEGQPLIVKSPVDYLWVTVRFADDEMEYTTDGSGLFTLTFKFVEALA